MFRFEELEVWKEGSDGSNANFRKYIGTAVGSALETVNILHFASRVGYIEMATKNDMYGKAERLIRKLRSFRNTLHD